MLKNPWGIFTFVWISTRLIRTEKSWLEYRLFAGMIPSVADSAAYVSRTRGYLSAVVPGLW